MKRALKLLLALLYLAFWVGFMVPIFGFILLLTLAKSLSRRVYSMEWPEL